MFFDAKIPSSLIPNEREQHRCEALHKGPLSFEAVHLASRRYR